MEVLVRVPNVKNVRHCFVEDLYFCEPLLGQHCFGFISIFGEKGWEHAVVYMGYVYNSTLAFVGKRGEAVRS
jgi:hypothetical protein